MMQRKSLEVNKFFSATSKSMGTLHFNLLKTKLHDRFIFGGNSKVWAGFINLAHMPKAIFEKLKTSKLIFKTLTFEDTGSISNNSHLAQIQDESGKIFDASSFLDVTDDGYLESFFVNGRQIGLNIKSMGLRKTIFTDKLILCLGAVQLLDLLYRSGSIANDSDIALTEFSYKLRYKFTFTPKVFFEGATIIRFNIARALFHFLGIQKNFNFLNFFKWLPFYIDQHFFYPRIKCTLKLSDGVISEKFSNKDALKFGNSIHYCNMHVNGEKINDYISKLSPNIIGLGAPFVDQIEPGPISNDIMNDAILKLRLLNINEE